MLKIKSPITPRGLPLARESDQIGDGVGGANSNSNGFGGNCNSEDEFFLEKYVTDLLSKQRCKISAPHPPEQRQRHIVLTLNDSQQKAQKKLPLQPHQQERHQHHSTRRNSTFSASQGRSKLAIATPQSGSPAGSRRESLRTRDSSWTTCSTATAGSILSALSKNSSISSSSTSSSTSISLSSRASHSTPYAILSRPAALLERPGLRDLPITDYVSPDDIFVESDIEGNFVIGCGAQARIFRAHIGSEIVAVKVSKDDIILQEYAFIKKNQHSDFIAPIAFSVFSDSSSSTRRSRSTSSLYRYARDGEFVYMACYEFAAHGDLGSYLNKYPKKRSDERFMIKVFGSILSAMNHLENCGYLHCDIKPENILVTKDEKVKLADFGMCQKIGDKMVPQGTPSFMAPEMLATWHSNVLYHRFNSSADVFSFGVLMTYTLSGKYPFKRITARLRGKDEFTQEELAQIFQQPKGLLREIEVANPLFGVMARMCLELSPSKRATATKLLALMQGIQSATAEDPVMQKPKPSNHH